MEVLLEHEHVVLLTIDGEHKFLHPNFMNVKVDGVFVCVLVVNGHVVTVV
jgi:hypothetical protein